MLKGINLKNFRSIREADISLDKVNVFCGRNNQGKSSIIEAIKLVLQGHNSWTSQKGDGYRALIRKGAKSALIQLQTDVGTIARQLPGKLYLDGKEDKTAVDEVLARMGISSRNLIALEDFMILSPKEQMNILASVEDHKDTPIEKFFIEILKGSPDAAIDVDVMVSCLKTVLPHGSIGVISLPEILDITEKNAREERKIANREKSNAQVKLQDLPSTNRLLPPEDEEKIKAMLKEKRKERDELLKLIAVAEEREKKLARQKQLEEVLKELDAKRQSIKTEDVSALKERAEELEQSVRQLDIELARLIQDGKALKELLDKLKNFSSTRQCPLIPAVKCNLLPQEIESIKDEYHKEIETKRKEYLEKTRAKEKAAAEYQAAKEAVERATEDNNVIMLLEQQIKTTQDELLLLAEEIKAQAQYTADELRDREAKISADIEKLEQELEKSKEFARAIARKAELEEEIAANELTAKALDFIIESIPKVKAMTAEGIQKFIENVNNGLSALNLPRATFDEENGLLIGGMAYKLLSTSEQLRAAMAVRHALCQLFKLPIYMVDNIDLLDASNFSAMVNFIKQITPTYKTIILAGTGEGVEYLPLGKVFVVRDGTVKEYSVLESIKVAAV